MNALRRSYDDAAALESLWTVHAFVDSHTFLTTGGHVGTAFRMTARDSDALDTPQRELIVRRFESALKLVDEHTRVYQYLCKREAPDLEVPATDGIPARAGAMLRARVAALNSRPRFVIEQYLVLLVEEPALTGLAGTVAIGERLTRQWTNPLLAVAQWLSPAQVVTLLDARIRRAVGILQQTGATLVHHLDDGLRLERLDHEATFRFLCALVTDDAPPVALRADLPIHRQMARASVTVQRDHLEVGRQCVQVLTMQDAPASTRAFLLEDLAQHPAPLLAVLEWKRLPADIARTRILRAQKHWNNKRRSPIAMMTAGADANPDDILTSESAGAMVQQLGTLQTEMDLHGHIVGMCSLSVVVQSEALETVREQTARLWKLLAARDGRFLNETTNLLRAWGAIVPGGAHLNVRYLELLETNLADLSFVFGVDGGDPRDAVAVLETSSGVPYHLSLAPDHDDTKHGLVLGSTGAGKSTFLSFLITQLQAVRPQIVVLDKGHGYRKLAEAYGGGYVELGLDSRLQINPFALPPWPAHLHFLVEFCKLLMKGDDGFTLPRELETRLFTTIENVYQLPRDGRRLSTLARQLRMTIPKRLDDWVDEGRFAALFDHVDDTLELADFQVFEFGKLREFPALVEPLQFYILHRTEQRLSPARMTVCVMDELEELLRQPTLRAHVEAAMPGWRKANGVMVLATQHVEALTRFDVLEKVVESCQTTYFLAADHRDRALYAKTFGLNERALDLLATLRRKRQFLVKRRGFAKVLDLTLTRDELDLFSNSVPPMGVAQPAAPDPMLALAR